MADPKKTFYLKIKDKSFYSTRKLPDIGTLSFKVSSSLQKLLAKTIQLSNIINHLSIDPSYIRPDIVREFLRNIGNIRCNFKKIAKINQKPEENLDPYLKEKHEKKDTLWPENPAKYLNVKTHKSENPVKITMNQDRNLLKNQEQTGQKRLLKLDAAPWNFPADSQKLQVSEKSPKNSQKSPKQDFPKREFPKEDFPKQDSTKTLQNETLPNETLWNKALLNKTLKNKTLQNKNFRNESLPNQIQSLQNYSLSYQSLQNQSLLNQSLANQSLPNQSLPNQNLSNQNLQNQSSCKLEFFKSEFSNKKKSPKSESPKTRVYKTRVSQTRVSHARVSKNRVLIN